MRPLATRACTSTWRDTAAAAIAFAALAVGHPSDGVAQTAEIIPFSGVIQIVDDATGERVDVDGTRPMRFFFYDDTGTWRGVEEYSDQDARSCSELDDCSVEIRGGRFSVALGQYRDLTDIFEDASGITVNVSMYVGDGWRSFGAQRIGLAPFATMAGAATDLDVDGTVNADTTAVGGDLMADAVEVDGDLVVNGPLSVSEVTPSSGLSLLGDVSVDGNVSTPTRFSLDDSTLVIPLNGADRTLLTAADIGSSAFVYLWGSNGVRLTEDDGAVTINGDLETYTGDSAGVDLSDGSIEFSRFSFGPTFYLINTHRIDMGTSASATLEVDPNDYHCTIGGLNFGSADLDYGDDRTAIRAYVTPNESDYTVIADIPSHNSSHEDHDVGIVCFDREYANIISEWGE